MRADLRFMMTGCLYLNWIGWDEIGVKLDEGFDLVNEIAEEEAREPETRDAF